MSQASFNPQAGGTSQTGNVNPWVITTIQAALNSDNFNNLRSLFLSSNIDMTPVTQFIRYINAEIEKQNNEHNVDTRQGCISPDHQYEIFMEKMMGAMSEKPEEEHQQILNNVNQELQIFNQMHHLPADWIFPQSIIETIRQELSNESDPSIKSEDDMDGLEEAPSFQSLLGSLGPQNSQNHLGSLGPQNSQNHLGSLSPQNSQNLPPVVTVEDGLDNLDSLEELARNTMFSYFNGEVLFWWKRGTGSQVFVKYGTAEHPIYRIRAGSYQPYDPKRATQILSIQRGGRREGAEIGSEGRNGMNLAQPRGHVKVIKEDNDGEFEETWMYTRADVAGILGVGWKVEDDDDGEGEPLDCLWPEGGEDVAYPLTRILVQWKDQTVTLEDRSFIRRIKKGPAKLADVLIYHKALSSEVLYRQQQGLRYEHLLDDLKSLKTDPRQKTPGVLPGIMPISESPDPSLPLPTQGTSPAPHIRVSTPASGGLYTPSPPRMTARATARGTTPRPMGTLGPAGTPRPTGTPMPAGTPGPAGSVPTRAERFSTMLQGRASAPATTPEEDPRDVQIRELQAQLAQLQLAINQPQPRYNLRSQPQMLAPPWGNQIPSDVFGYSPEPPRGRKSRGRKSRGQPPNWSYWAGQYAMPSPAYYSY